MAGGRAILLATLGVRATLGEAAWIALRGVVRQAASIGIAVQSVRTAADGLVPDDLTVRVHSATAEARISAFPADTGVIEGTVVVAEALGSAERIVVVQRRIAATAHRHVVGEGVTGVVWIAGRRCARMTRVRLTDSGEYRLSRAVYVGIAEVCIRADALSEVVRHSAFGVDTAHVAESAGIGTFHVDAGTIVRAVGVYRALRITACLGISEEIGQARADCTISHHLAESVAAAGIRPAGTLRWFRIHRR